MGLEDDLAEHLSRFKSAPFLFVGSGMSKRYLGLDSWRPLLDRFAADLPRPFGYYFSSAHGDLPLVASYMADDFHDVWWSSSKYADARAAYGGKLIDRTSALKLTISQYLLEREAEWEPESIEARELDLLRGSVIDGIITTNWDLLLERNFPDYVAYVGQDDILFGNPQGVGEIYKIHGSATHPDSLVLTRQDYERFRDRGAYLAAKLTTTFVEHPVVFLGYSLSDDNILDILRSIGRCLTPRNVPDLQDRLIFVEYAPTAPRESLVAAPLAVEGLTIPITSARVRNFLEVFGSLRRGERKFPARMLRQLKEHVYELVRDNDPQSRFRVADIDQEADLSGLEVVFGVGAVVRDEREGGLGVGEKGYRAIKRDDLVADVIGEYGGLDPVQVLSTTLPETLKSAKWTPVFKYASEAGYFDTTDAGNGEVSALVERRLHVGTEFFLPSQGYLKARERVLQECESLDEMIAHGGTGYALNYAAFLVGRGLELEGLRRFLSQTFKNRGALSDFEQTQFYRLVCLYDYLAYGQAKMLTGSD